MKRLKIPKEYEYSYIPPTTEWHGINANFLGPGTQVSNRLSLRYKGNVGTESYWLPSSTIDYTSLKHDLLYFSPSNLVKGYADFEYLKELNKYAKGNDLNSYLATFGIAGTYLYRLYPTIGTGLFLAKNFKGKLKQNIKEIVKIFKITPLSGYLFNPTTGILPDRIKQELDRISRNLFGFNLRPATRGRQAYTDLLYNKIIPLTLIYGLGFIGKPIKEVKNFVVNSLIPTFIKSEEYQDVKKVFDKTINSYSKYLDYVSNVNYDKGTIDIKEDYDKEEAKKLYVDFYDEYKNYLEFINNYYKDYPDFKPWIIPELNENNLNLVANPQEADILDEKEQLEEFKKIYDNDVVKLKNEKELNDEIIKVLEGKQEKPFTSPVEVKEEIKPEKELTDEEIDNMINNFFSEVGISGAEPELQTDEELDNIITNFFNEIGI